VDFRRSIAGDRGDRHYRGLNQIACTKKSASAKADSRCYFTAGGDNACTNDCAGSNPSARTGLGRANSDGRRADGAERSNLAMHDQRPKDLLR
jgi:hypothetical protein